jgi:hypothetical protein
VSSQGYQFGALRLIDVALGKMNFKGSLKILRILSFRKTLSLG